MRRWPNLVLVVVGSCAASCGGGAAEARPAAGASAPHAILFEGGRLFDGESFREADVLVVGTRIEAVGPTIDPPASAERVDARGHTLLPGLIDAHTHAGMDVRTLELARVLGVTLEVDLFGPPSRLVALRAAEREGRDTGQADLRGAGTLATVPGGHGTEYGIPIPTLTMPDEAPSFVDARIAEGSDLLKLVYDHTEPSQPTLSIETVRALVEAAHARHLLVVAHIGSEQDARDVAEAGVDGLAHLFVDHAASPETVAALVAHHTFVIPTLTTAARGCGDHGGPSIGEEIAADGALSPFLTDDERARLGRTRGYDRTEPGCFDTIAASIPALRAAGVPILAGTDAINPGTAHGASLHGELSLLVRAGLTTAEALASATSVPARVFSLDDRGRIAPGMRADLVLVEGDPERDVRATRAIRRVLHAGSTVARTLPPPAPSGG
jgi:imidazolonepropionase-like amidohydrolase